MRFARSTSSCSRSADAATRARYALVTLLLFAAGCAGGAPPAARPAPRTLPPDSAALLAEAIRLARPAFAYQAEALRAGVYAAATPTPRAPALAARGGGEAGGIYVIQIAAFRDRLAAELAADEAARRFPGLDVVVEDTDNVFRVALAGWAEPTAAHPALQSVRRHYPDAWIRRRAVP